MPNEVAVIGDYDIRDRKLADATSQSTIASTDAIEMKTTDGNQVYIDKSSFINAIGQAFTASDPKTFTKLLGMNGDNNPMGIGASDLASVLGVRNWIYYQWTPSKTGAQVVVFLNAIGISSIYDIVFIVAVSERGGGETRGFHSASDVYWERNEISNDIYIAASPTSTDCTYHIYIFTK